MTFEIIREKNEPSYRLVRRFLLRIKRTGILNTAKKKRFYIPPLSKNARKRSFLRYLRKKEERVNKDKLGLS